MTEYTYERTLVNGVYNIDNPLRLSDGKQVYLAKEVSVAIPGELFKLRCNGLEAKFIFENTLTSENKAILDALVLAHKNNT